MLKQANPKHASGRIYGLITALALLVTLEAKQKPSLTTIIVVFVTLVTIWLAESYAHYYVKAYQNKRSLSKDETLHILKEEVGVVLSSNMILIPFVLELLGLMSLANAYNWSQFLGVAILFVIGYRLAIRLEKKLPGRIVSGAVSASLGLVIVLMKALFK